MSVPSLFDLQYMYSELGYVKLRAIFIEINCGNNLVNML